MPAMELGTTSHLLLCVCAICPPGLKPFVSLLSSLTLSAKPRSSHFPESQRPALILVHQVTLPFPPNSALHLQPLLGLGNFRDPPAFPKSKIFYAVVSLSVPAPTGLLLEE